MRPPESESAKVRETWTPPNDPRAPAKDGRPDVEGTHPSRSANRTLPDDFVEILKKRYGVQNTKRMSDRQFAWWELKAKAKHLVGIHTFLETEEWDRQAGSVRFIGEVCWLCHVRQ